MNFLKNFFKIVFILFLIFGVGRYILESARMYNTLSDEQVSIENTFANLHKSDEKTLQLFEQFADNLFYRKWANYFITIRSNFDGWDKESSVLKDQLVSKLGPNSHEAKYIEALHTSYGTCCKPKDWDRWKLMGESLGEWVTAMDNMQQLPSEEELGVLKFVLRDTAFGKRQRPVAAGNYLFRTVFYMLGNDGFYDIGLSRNSYWQKLKSIGFNLTKPLANLTIKLSDESKATSYAGLNVVLGGSNNKPTNLPCPSRDHDACLLKRDHQWCQEDDWMILYEQVNYFTTNSNKENKLHALLLKTGDFDTYNNKHLNCKKWGYPTYQEKYFKIKEEK
jgi:hypothetical protein